MRGPCVCMLCEHTEEESRDKILKHVIEDHNLVIADVGQIADLSMCVLNVCV